MTFEHRLDFWSKLTVLEFLITDATEPDFIILDVMSNQNNTNSY